MACGELRPQVLHTLETRALSLGSVVASLPCTDLATSQRLPGQQPLQSSPRSLASLFSFHPAFRCAFEMLAMRLWLSSLHSNGCTSQAKFHQTITLRSKSDAHDFSTAKRVDGKAPIQSLNNCIMWFPDAISQLSTQENKLFVAKYHPRA